MRRRQGRLHAESQVLDGTAVCRHRFEGQEVVSWHEPFQGQRPRDVGGPRPREGIRQQPPGVRGPDHVVRICQADRHDDGLGRPRAALVDAQERRRLVPGPVLVAPEAGGQALYREMRMLERRDVAMGSHALWRQVTTRGLRDARALAGIATACAAFGLLAQLLGA